MTITNDGCRADKRKARAEQATTNDVGAEVAAVLTEAEREALLRAHVHISPTALIATVEHIIAAREQTALHAAAHDLRTNAARAWGGTYGWYTTGRHVAGLAADWITHLADGRHAAPPTPASGHAPDAPLSVGSEREAATAPLAGYFIAPDAANDPCVWGEIPGNPNYPRVALEGWRIQRDDPDLWAAIVATVEGTQP